MASQENGKKFKLVGSAPEFRPRGLHKYLRYVEHFEHFELGEGNAAVFTGPPLNAPTGPSALRDMPSVPDSETQWIDETGQENGQVFDPVTGNPAWTQSNSWISDECAQRAGFDKMISSFKYMRAEESPAAPQNLGEYLEIKNFNSQHQQAKLKRKIESLERRSKAPSQQSKSSEDDNQYNAVWGYTEPLGFEGNGMAGAAMKEEEDWITTGNADFYAPAPVAPLADGRVFNDGRSFFFGVESCWNGDHVDGSGMTENDSDWPCPAQLQEVGDKCARRGSRRSLPFPRVYIATDRHCSARPKTRKARIQRLLLKPVEHEDLTLYRSDPVEFDLDEVSKGIQEIVKEADDFRPFP